MRYLIKTPWIVKKWIYPDYCWSMPSDQKIIYLSFDDGPHPEATPFVLEQLRKYDAKATFFCIGKNVLQYPEIYRNIMTEGHATGNHTYDHLNGWKTDNETYFENIAKAANYIHTDLFRPPYGRITRFQAALARERFGLNTIMWSVLSADFDVEITPQQCWKNVEKATGSGSIVVFHDSGKALPRMSVALPLVLEKFTELGYRFNKITL